MKFDAKIQTLLGSRTLYTFDVYVEENSGMLVFEPKSDILVDGVKFAFDGAFGFHLDVNDPAVMNGLSFYLVTSPNGPFVGYSPSETGLLELPNDYAYVDTIAELTYSKDEDSLKGWVNRVVPKVVEVGR